MKRYRCGERTVLGTVTVSANPYFQPDRQQEVFKAQLTKIGILPIEIFIQHQGEIPLFVHASDIVLVLPNGNQIEQTGAIQVANKFQAGILSHFPGYVAFGLPGMFASMVLSDTEMAARKADYQRKNLKDIILAKNESTRGFVYFLPPPGTQSFKRAELVIKLVDREEGSSLVVRLPLSGLIEFPIPS